MSAPQLRRISSLLLAATIIALALACPLAAQTAPSTPQAAPSEAAPKTDPVREQAVNLYKQGKMVEAMPLFENLCTLYPKDMAMWEDWGMTTLGYSQTLPDADRRKKARALARSRLGKAKELGDNSNLLQILMAEIPEDGGEGTYSASKESQQHHAASGSRFLPR